MIVVAPGPYWAMEAGRLLAIAPQALPPGTPGKAPPPIRMVPAGRHGWRLLPAARAPLRRRQDALFALLQTASETLLGATLRPVAHAGAFVGERGAILCLGAPRSGKSRVVFAAWQRGLEVIGDDRVVLWPERGLAGAFPKCIKIRPAGAGAEAGAGAGLAALPPGQWIRGYLAGEPRLLVSRALPHMAPYEGRYPVRAIALLAPGRATAPRLERVRGAPALEALFAHMVAGRFAPMSVVRLLKELAESGRVVRAHFSLTDPLALVERLASL